MSEVNHSRASGNFQCFDASGKATDGATLSCAHCQATWVMRKGSGRLRGFCANCMGYVCGAGCSDCVPLEVRLENVEAGRHELTPAPARILVPRGIEGVTGG